MNEIITIVAAIGLLVLFVLIMRAIGAWMLRIDEVIRELKEIKDELKKKAP